MERRTNAALALLLIALIVGVFVVRKPHAVAPPASATASASAAPSASSVPSNEAAGSDDEDGGAAFDLGDAGALSLPASAPKQVGFGVVLFTYEGAQSAPRGARSKSAALELARSLVPEAKKDFAAAVKKGDHGSLADAGKMPRGILEPPIEFALFSLAKGQVADDPIDTLRGYWVLRRTE